MTPVACRRMKQALAALSVAAILAAALPASAHPRQLIGHPAPELRARPLDSDGTVDLADHRGHVVLIVFYATWCSACRRMAPQIERLADEHRDEGLEVLAFSNEPRDRLREHARVDPRSYPRAQCTGRTSLRYEARALPTMILVDREGVVRAAYQSSADDVVRRLRSDLARLL
jgi:thiol-disulfide isomerase/thioredoxin